jgi:chromosome segregation ATPase
MMPFRPILLLAALVAPMLHAADGPSPAEAKLREQLRSALLQARNLQAERDTLQAAKIQLETEKKAAEEQAAKLQKQIAADKESADKAIAELRDKVTAQGDQLTQIQQSLDKWKAAHAEVTSIAQKKEGERAKLAQDKIELERIVADQRTRNLAMYRVGKEILDRYEKFGLGTALSAREPFTGAMRVKLENLVQDLGDKLSEQRIKPEPGKPTPSAEKPAAPTNTKPKTSEPKPETTTRKAASLG